MPGTRGTYRRVLLKLSGEVFGGEKGIGVDINVMRDVAKQIKDVVKGGVQLAVVVGGGNYFRGAELQQVGMDRARADYMGMLGTVMNCLALQDFLEKKALTLVFKQRSPWVKLQSHIFLVVQSATWKKGG